MQDINSLDKTLFIVYALIHGYITMLKIAIDMLLFRIDLSNTISFLTVYKLDLLLSTNRTSANTNHRVQTFDHKPNIHN